MPTTEARSTCSAAPKGRIQRLPGGVVIRCAWSKCVGMRMRRINHGIRSRRQIQRQFGAARQLHAQFLGETERYA